MLGWLVPSPSNYPTAVNRAVRLTTGRRPGAARTPPRPLSTSVGCPSLAGVPSTPAATFSLGPEPISDLSGPVSGQRHVPRPEDRLRSGRGSRRHDCTAGGGDWFRVTVADDSIDIIRARTEQPTTIFQTDVRDTARRRFWPRGGHRFRAGRSADRRRRSRGGRALRANVSRPGRPTLRLSQRL